VTTYADPGAIADVVGTSGRIEATWGNAVRDRLVHRFASTASRDAAIPSPTEGMVCYVTVTHTYYEYNGTSWRARDLINQTYVPTWLQSATGITCTVNVADYRRDGDWCDVAISLTATGSGSGGVRTRVTLPVAPAATGFGVGGIPVGQGTLYDTSAALYYPFFVQVEDGTYFTGISCDIASNVNLGATGATFSATIASGDVMRFSARYRIA
jgi:hypothetical protein